MTIMVTRVPLADKEPEALLWGLSQLTDVPNREPRGPADPFSVLEPLTDLEKAILRVCVENTTWLQPYIENRPEYVAIAKKTLRDLARSSKCSGSKSTTSRTTKQEQR
jgi:hypothetical protein